MFGPRCDADLSRTTVRISRVMQAGVVVIRPVAAHRFHRLIVESIALRGDLRRPRHKLGFCSENIERDVAAMLALRSLIMPAFPELQFFVVGKAKMRSGRITIVLLGSFACPLGQCVSKFSERSCVSH